jgi:Cu/Ag efflux pump CusA
MVRGVGLVASPEDLENVVIGASAGVPGLCQQVGTVRIGSAFRVSSLVEGP